MLEPPGTVEPESPVDLWDPRNLWGGIAAIVGLFVGVIGAFALTGSMGVLMMFVFGPICGWIGYFIGYSFGGSIYEQRQQRERDSGMPIWESAYYCEMHDLVLVPGRGAPYSPPEFHQLVRNPLEPANS